jgi:hypothetical protein
MVRRPRAQRPYLDLRLSKTLTELPRVLVRRGGGSRKTARGPPPVAAGSIDEEEGNDPGSKGVA